MDIEQLIFNNWISYSRETIEKRFGRLTEIDLDHERFSSGLTCKVGNVSITFGKLPSGRYVYLSSWAVYPLRQFI